MKTNAITQISSELNRFLQEMQVILPPSAQKRLQRLSRKIAAPKGWVLGSLGLLLLWVWVWQWFLSIAIGLLAMSGVYLAQQGRLKIPGQRWRSKLLNRSNRSLTMASAAGLLALSTTYLATAVWTEADQHWLATSILLEGFGILAIGSLLIWQLFNRPAFSPALPDRQFQQWLNDFSHTDPLKRLIAVRQTTRSVLADSLHSLPMTAAELADCLRLMLNRETEAIVCNALIESLQILTPTRQLEGTHLSTVTMPSAVKSKQAQPLTSQETP